eukprot:gene18907-60670_t
MTLEALTAPQSCTAPPSAQYMAPAGGRPLLRQLPHAPMSARTPLGQKAGAMSYRCGASRSGMYLIAFAHTIVRDAILIAAPAPPSGPADC